MPRGISKESLRDRIKRIAAASAPSLMPQDLEPKENAPPAREMVVLPKLSDLVPDRALSLELARKAWRLGEIAKAKSELSKEEKPIKEWVKGVAGRFKIGEAETGFWRLKYYASPRTTIKEELLVKALLARGWQPKDIAKLLEESTSTSDGFTLKVSPLGAKEIENGEDEA